MVEVGLPRHLARLSIFSAGTTCHCTLECLVRFLSLGVVMLMGGITGQWLKVQGL